MAKLRMQVEGMTCAHCETTVEGALESEGAKSIRADFRHSEAIFEFGGDESKLGPAISDAGYVPGKVEALEAQAAILSAGEATSITTSW